MIFLIFFLMCGLARADVYVITAPDKSVYSLSEQDDAVLPKGYSKNVIKNKGIKDLTVSMGEEKLYDFNGSKFSLDEKKVQEKNKAENDLILLKQKRENDKASALKKMKDFGLTDNEIHAVFGD